MKGDHSSLVAYIIVTDWTDFCCIGTKQTLSPSCSNSPLVVSLWLDGPRQYMEMSPRSFPRMLPSLLVNTSCSPTTWRPTYTMTSWLANWLQEFSVNLYSKKQATIETATNSSELLSTHLAVNQIVDLHLTLQYLGVPINEKSYLFGDNKSVVDSSSQPHDKLHKWYNALSFHQVHEVVATGLKSKMARLAADRFYKGYCRSSKERVYNHQRMNLIKHQVELSHGNQQNVYGWIYEGHWNHMSSHSLQ